MTMIITETIKKWVARIKWIELCKKCDFCPDTDKPLKGEHVISYKDKTFCGSPNCKNECGRKMTEEERKELVRLNKPDKWDGTLMVAYAYFCGEPDAKLNQ